MSGHKQADVPARFARVPVVGKPFLHDELVALLTLTVYGMSLLFEPRCLVSTSLVTMADADDERYAFVADYLDDEICLEREDMHRRLDFMALSRCSALARPPHKAVSLAFSNFRVQLAGQSAVR